MRVEGNRNSESYWGNSFAEAPLIRIDGKTVDHVVMADDCKGVVEVQIHENGKVLVDQAAGLILTRFINGKVEIVGRRLGEAAN